MASRNKINPEQDTHSGLLAVCRTQLGSSNRAVGCRGDGMPPGGASHSYKTTLGPYQFHDYVVGASSWLAGQGSPAGYLQGTLAQFRGRPAPRKSLILLAPRAGFEPATNRLTAGCSTTELPGKIAAARASAVAYSKAAPALKAA